MILTSECKSNTNSINGILLIGLGIIFLIFIPVSRVFDLDFYIMVLDIFFYGYLAYMYPNFFLRYLFIFFQFTSNLAGVLVIEHTDIWLSELLIFSHPANSFVLLSFSLYLFTFITWLFDTFIPMDHKPAASFFDFKINKSTIKLWHLFLIVFSLLLFAVAVKCVPHPAFLEQMDRFAYRNAYLNEYWIKIFNLLRFSIPVLIALTFKYRNKIFISLFFVYAIVLFSVGEKFGAFYIIVNECCAIYSIYGDKIPKKKLRNKLISLFIVFLILIALVFVHRVITYESGAGSFSNYFVQRVAQQGQLWWKIYDTDKDAGFHTDELTDEFNVFFQVDTEEEKLNYHGISKIMKLTTPSYIVNAKLDSGSFYAWSTLASIFYYFKEPGLIVFSIIAPIIFVLLTRAFLYSTENLLVLEMLLSSKLMIGFCSSTLVLSGFDVFFSYKNFICLFLLFVLIILRKQNFQKSNSK